MTKLGRYELLEKLGEGGMGAVWLGRLTGEGGFEKLCIIKTVLPALAKDSQFVSRFLHEGRVLTQLQHSNIAQVFDMGREGEVLYLALEYVPGVDLSNLTLQLRNQQQPVPLAFAVYLIHQVAEGLAFAHRKTSNDGSPLSIVHRDVSPQNVMISFEGEVKVIDFGIAKSEARSQATATATVMGKLGYMAPEQARGEPVDARADQFACGVLLWELLTQVSFVPRGTMTEMVVAMTHPTIRPLAPLRPDVPPSLEAVVLKALAADQEQRFESTDDFASALMTQLLQLSGPPTKRAIGAWVRANCSNDFQANQALLTRISSSKATVTGDGQTFVRTPTAPGGPSTAEVARLAVPRPTARWLIAAAVALPLLVGAMLGLAGKRDAQRPQVGLDAARSQGHPLAPSKDENLRPSASTPAVDAPGANSPGEVLSATPQGDAGRPLATLLMQGRMSAGREWSVILSNRMPLSVTQCRVIIANQKVAQFAVMAMNASVELPGREFRFEPSVPKVPSRSALVQCEQGQATVRW